MLYAQVIVKKKTQVEELSYRIPASIVPVIKVGSLVSVPLRQKTVPAVVVKFVRSVPMAIKPKLREIISIERGNSHFSATQINVIHRLADYYGATLAEVAFHALQEPNFWPPSNSNEVRKPLFIQGTWVERRNYYQKLLEKLISKHILFIFAQNSYAEDFFNSIPIELKEYVIYDIQKSVNRKKLQELIRQQKPVSLISTASDVFWPLMAGDTIIIDQPSHIGAVSAQRPFMSAEQIGRIRSEIEHLQLILGDTLVKIENLPLLQRRQWQLQALPSIKKPVFISDRRGSKELILPTLVEKITARLNEKEKVLVLVLARGWASALVCRDCGYIFICENCQRAAVVREASLECPYCSTVTDRPLTCPECQGANLQPVGEGVAQVAKKLQQLFPDNRVGALSSDQPELDELADILVTTEKILSFPQALFDEVVIISADRLLSGTHLNGSSQLLSDILELQERSKSLAVQTYLPDNPVWSIVGHHQLRKFYVQELTSRRRLKLPPFSTIFRLVGLARTINELEKQAEIVSDKLLELFPAAEISFLEIDGRSGRNYRGHVQVLTPAHLTTKLKHQIAHELPPSWHLKLE